MLHSASLLGLMLRLFILGWSRCLFRQAECIRVTGCVPMDVDDYLQQIQNLTFLWYQVVEHA